MPHMAVSRAFSCTGNCSVNRRQFSSPTWFLNPCRIFVNISFRSSLGCDHDATASQKYMKSGTTPAGFTCHVGVTVSRGMVRSKVASVEWGRKGNVGVTDDLIYLDTTWVRESRQNLPGSSGRCRGTRNPSRRCPGCYAKMSTCILEYVVVFVDKANNSNNYLIRI